MEGRQRLLMASVQCRFESQAHKLCPQIVKHQEHAYATNHQHSTSSTSDQAMQIKYLQEEEAHQSIKQQSLFFVSCLLTCYGKWGTFVPMSSKSAEPASSNLVLLHAISIASELRMPSERVLQWGPHLLLRMLCYFLSLCPLLPSQQLGLTAVNEESTSAMQFSDCCHSPLKKNLCGFTITE